MATPELQNAHYIEPSQLCVGLHVHLDLSWREHPFTFSSFLIKTAEQVAQIQALGLARVRYSPDKSTKAPLAAAAASRPRPRPAAAAPAAATQAPAAGGTEVKRQLACRLDALLARMRECQASLQHASRSARRVLGDVHRNPAGAMKEATRLVEDLAMRMPVQGEIAIHLMSDKMEGEEVYQHALNVSVLALMLARELQVGPADMHQAGLGALFHDVGHMELPVTLVRKTQALSRHEASLMQAHVTKGVELGRRLALPDGALAVLAQHHEHADGTGYPRQLRNHETSTAAKIVAIVNAFDELCNPPDASKALTPHEALSLLYGQQRPRFDARILATFVKCIGIYPPGTVVELSNGTIGMVVSVNGSRPLKPAVMVFDSSVPRSRALVVELEQEPDVSVAKTMRPSQLTAEILEYLAPRRRTAYFVDAEHPPGTPGK